ncbi:MAG: hypothetical protein IPL53_25245 [Ignavibacteria bacterium]|nr:hypothetical protein [Ignavibacteria bacterium]
MKKKIKETAPLKLQDIHYRLAIKFLKKLGIVQHGLPGNVIRKRFRKSVA